MVVVFPVPGLPLMTTKFLSIAAVAATLCQLVFPGAGFSGK
jgi:hypothetical protein